MADPRRPASQSRFATTVIEQNIAPPPRTPLPVAQPVSRMQTPVGMPAPPPTPVERERESYDDLDQVLRIERMERERAQLLAQLQDAQEAALDARQEARTLREIAPVAIFPPPSLPPPPSSEKKKPAPIDLERLASDLDIKALEKALAGSKLGRAAVGLGILVALGWNAFNSVRSAPERVEAVQARITQSEKDRDEKLVQDDRERQRNLQALRAIYCWGKQLRGASARRGLDLPSLPPGGVTATRIDQGDPSKPPVFVAAEPCPTPPVLPPELPGP